MKHNEMRTNGNILFRQKVYDIAQKTLKNYADGAIVNWLGPDLILFREDGGNSSKDSKHFVLDLRDSSITPIN